MKKIKTYVVGTYIDISSKKEALEYTKKHPTCFPLISIIYLSDELFIEAIKGSEFAFNHIPKKFQTEKLKLLHEALWVL